MVSSFQRESPIPGAIATWTLNAFVRPTGPILSRCPPAICVTDFFVVVFGFCPILSIRDPFVLTVLLRSI